MALKIESYGFVNKYVLKRKRGQNWFDALCQGLIRTEMEPWLKEQLFMLRKQCILKAKLDPPTSLFRRHSEGEFASNLAVCEVEMGNGCMKL